MVVGRDMLLRVQAAQQRGPTGASAYRFLVVLRPRPFGFAQGRRSAALPRFSYDAFSLCGDVLIPAQRENSSPFRKTPRYRCRRCMMRSQAKPMVIRPKVDGSGITLYVRWKLSIAKPSSDPGSSTSTQRK